MLLRGKVVLVTGGSAGIGRAVAIGAARAGADVAINYVGPGAGAESAASQIRALGRKCVLHEGDVADPATAPAFVEAAVAALGRIDGLVSNAGICPFHSFLDMPVALLERVTHVNQLGSFYMAQAVARHLVGQRDGGSIVAVSSISALVGGEFQTHYTPTKAAVHSIMQSAAIALGPHRIRCNSVLPGTVLTDINRDDLTDPAKRDAMERRVPLGRLGDPEDIVGPVVFLLSEMAEYVTGAALLVDGGMFVNLQ